MGADINKFNSDLHYVFLKVPDDLMETREDWKSKVEVLGRTLWRTRNGGGHGPIVREAAE
jgi:hypothetical protein